MGNTFGETATEAIEQLGLNSLKISGDVKPQLKVPGDEQDGWRIDLGQSGTYPQTVNMSGSFSVFQATDGQNIEINKGDWQNLTLHGSNVNAPDGFNTPSSYALKDSDGNTTNIWYDGGNAFVNTLRNYASDSTLWVVRSQAGDPEVDSRESTLGLTRTDDAGKTEVLDLYNNGFHGSGGADSSIGHDGDFPVSVGMGLRVQKRGSFYREFMFDWYDGNTRTPGWRMLSPDQTLGPTMWFEGGLPISHSGGTPLEIIELGEGSASGKVRCRNVNFADGVVEYDDGTGELSVATNSFGINSATRQSAGVWRVVLAQGSSPVDLVPSVGPGLPIWVSGTSRRESPQWSWEQDPDGDNPQEVEIRFEVSDDAGNTTLVDPQRIAFKATVMS